MIRAIPLLAAAVFAATCNPGPEPKPSPSPTPTATVTVPEPPPELDAGPVSACSAARQKMVEMGCPPPEDAFGGWVVECSGWAQGSVITSCVMRQAVCVGAHQCLGDQ